MYRIQACAVRAGKLRVHWQSMQLGPAITSKSNERVKALRASFSGKASRPGDVVGIEGEHLLVEAVRSGLEFQTLFVRVGSEHLLERPALAKLIAKHRVFLRQDVFDSAVETGTPQGIAAIVSIPPQKFLEMRANPGTFLFVENIQDPGNLGTLIRSAEAFGVRCLYASPGTVNAWNPKVIRASVGSVFRLPVYSVTLKEFAELTSWGGIKTAAAVAQSEKAVASQEADLTAPTVLMIGNEGAGLSAEALSLANQLVHIPCSIESLNAAIAGSVLMYEAARQNQKLFERGAV